MTFAVGVLYSIQEFLELASEAKLIADQFADKSKFGLSDATVVLKVAQECNWIRVTLDERLVLTERGELIRGAASATDKLRLQVEDVISKLQPAWAAKIRHGRAEVIPGMNAEERQCFKECGLLGEWQDDLIEWWDRASQLARLRWSEKLSKTGRLAEWLTYQYEIKRTGREPQRICLDTNFAGFDVLSLVSSSDDTPLPIEVKGSERRAKEADFVLTRGEFRAAKKSKNYEVHLWAIGATNSLFVVPFAEVQKHLPVDQLSGQWENVRIPYSPFMAFQVATPAA